MPGQSQRRNMMSRWGRLTQCNRCPHRQACDHRLPLGQAPNPLCPDGWAEGPVPAHMIPGPDYEPPRSQKYSDSGEWRRERDRDYQYSLHHFCLMCACWERKHTRVTNGSSTWLCRRHLNVFQRWKRKEGRPPLPRKPANKNERKRAAKYGAIAAALSDGPRSLREIATALGCSVESVRFHLNALARLGRTERIPLRRGQAWIAWQLTPRIDIIQANITQLHNVRTVDHK